MGHFSTFWSLLPKQDVFNRGKIYLEVEQKEAWLPSCLLSAPAKGQPQKPAKPRGRGQCDTPAAPGRAAVWNRGLAGTLQSPPHSCRELHLLIWKTLLSFTLIFLLCSSFKGFHLAGLCQRFTVAFSSSLCWTELYSLFYFSTEHLYLPISVLFTLCCYSIWGCVCSKQQKSAELFFLPVGVSGARSAVVPFGFKMWQIPAEGLTWE